LTNALVIRATFEPPSAGSGIELESFARIAKRFDLTLGTAWLIGAERILRMKTVDVDVANAFARWNQTGLLGMVARHRIVSRVAESMSENDPATPRVTFFDVGPPLHISILLPAAFLREGAPAVSFRMLERVFRSPVHITTKQASLEAETAEWLAFRSQAELKVIDAAADEIASPPRPSASRLEIDEPNSGGH
jgi:hypothetical protein